MPSYTVSLFLSRLDELYPVTSGPGITGAALSTARLLKSLLSASEVEAMGKVFVPPSEFQHRDDMSRIARAILPEHRLGQGSLRFYPAHFAPDIWADGVERILISTDTCFLARDQYLRSRFAKAPMAIHCLTHGMGQPETFESFRLATSCRSDAISCLSTACLEAIRRTLRHFSQDAEVELTVLRNTVDLNRFSPVGTGGKQRARSMLRLPGEGTISLYFGRVTPASKSDLLPFIRQFAAVSSERDHLLIAGVENYPGYLSKCLEDAARLGIANRVIARGGIDHDLSPLFYEAADLFVFPCDNIQESFANTVAEAMACGLPVLATNWDGLRDLIVDGETGFMAPAYLMPGLGAIEEFYVATPLMDNYLLISQNTIVDEKLLGLRLRQLLEDQNLRGRMGAASRRRVQELCDWNVIKAQVFELWDRLLSSARSATPPSPHVDLCVPIRELFGAYGTMVDPPAFSVKLTEFGELVVTGRANLQFYEPTLSLIRSEVVDSIFQHLRPGGSHRLDSAAEEISARLGVTLDLVYFHLGLLVKRGAIELERTGPML